MLWCHTLHILDVVSSQPDVAILNIPFLFLYRLARKLGEVMETLRDKEVDVISTVPLPPLEACFSNHLMLHMSWTEELHQSCVYSNTCS